MTIHKSKGLEFPIVFLTGLAGQFNPMDLNNAIIQNARFGIGINAVDPVSRTKHSSLLHRSIRNMNRRDMLGEELRVLYVALTRAREKLILTSVLKDPEDLPAVFDSNPLSYMQRSNAKSFLAWILMALSKDTPVDVSVIEPGEIGAAELETAGKDYARIEFLRELLQRFGQTGERGAGYNQSGEHSAGCDLHPDPELDAFLEKKAAFRYPCEELAELPAKLSVSEIKKRSIEEQMEEKGMELYREEPVVPLVPAFLKHTGPESDYTGAARGTIYHKIFAALDLPRISDDNDLQIQIGEMIEDGRLTEEEAEAVSRDDLMRFLKSPIGMRMRKAQDAGTLVREQPFVIDIPANEIRQEYGTPEPILVQGVIDAYFEEDDGFVIVDYKTDRVKLGDGRDLAEKYRIQLAYYKQALEQILDIHVKEMYLYSVTLGREIPV